MHRKAFAIVNGLSPYLGWLIRTKWRGRCTDMQNAQRAQEGCGCLCHTLSECPKRGESQRFHREDRPWQQGKNCLGTSQEAGWEEKWTSVGKLRSDVDLQLQLQSLVASVEQTVGLWPPSLISCPLPHLAHVCPVL